ncbi:hypothetical protein [Dyadobacter sp.]|uniref:hypothetical protein n=1 Tax=Dyadobacter sp. TaxID=1914288 RepID=UPI003F7277A1
MGQEYALDWIDQMVNELDPQTTEPESFDNNQSLAIRDKAAEEKKRLITLFKQFVFQKKKARQIKNTVNNYLSVAASLITIASNNLNRLPTKADNFRHALESVVSCLNEASAFIVKRYSNLVDRDISLSMVASILVLTIFAS